MTADFTVGPVKHGIDSDVAWSLAHPELLLDAVSVERGQYDGLGVPVVMVGDDEVFPHDVPCRLDLCIVPAEAHGFFRESQSIEFVTDMELFAELAITGGDGFRISPLGFTVTELLPELDEFRFQLVQFPGHIMKFFAFCNRVEGDDNGALPAPKGQLGPVVLLIAAIVPLRGRRNRATL